MLTQDQADPRLPDPGEAFQDWLEAEGGARLIVERAGRIVWSNTRARRMLSEATCVTGAGGVLSAVNRSQQIQLRTYLDDLNGGPQVSVVMSADETKPPLVIIGCALRLDSGDYLGLRLRQVSDSPRLLVADLTPAYKLTGMERQVVRRLIEGETAEGISKANGQSIDTVRTHIRNIYNKIGVSSREALFARVFQYLFWLD
jgi:DNA-binding CsgD family transcriptional regulator